jgi:hypothetical protein
VSGKKTDTPDDALEGVLKAITAFEEILEVIPDDQASLEALCHAYEQVGDEAKAAGYMVRLAAVLIENGDTEGARELLPRLAAHRDGSREAPSAIARLEAKLSPSEEKASPAEVDRAGSVSHSFSMQESLGFAWRLLQARELSDAEYSKVVEALTEMSVSEGAATTSVLHVLQHGGFKGLERILNFAAGDCGTPVISLSGYEIPPDVSGLLPVTFVVGRGAIPFGLLGAGDILVAVMNPYDHTLVADVKSLTGRTCHSYLTLPSEFDAAVSKILGVSEPKAKKPATGRQ